MDRLQGSEIWGQLPWRGGFNPPGQGEPGVWVGVGVTQMVFIFSAAPGAVSPWLVQSTQPGPRLILYIPVAGTGPPSVTRLPDWWFRLLASSQQEAGQLNLL